MQYADLKQFIQSTPELSGLTNPADILAAIMLPRMSLAVLDPDIPRRTVLRTLAGLGIISKVYDAARNQSLPHQIRSICFAVEAMLNAGAEGLDISSASTTAMMGALKAASIISQSDIDALTAVAMKPRSLFEANNIEFYGRHALDVEDIINTLES